jgi:hypothetical protein
MCHYETSNVTVSKVVDVAVTVYILYPGTDVDTEEVTPPENTAFTVFGILIITTPEPPLPPAAAW